MKRKVCVACCMLVLFSGRAWALKPAIHEEVCQDILPTTTRTVDGETLSFAEKAIIEIRKANRKTDTSVNVFSNAFASYKHFDAEEFSKASQHLITKREDVISKVTAGNPNGQKARESLGTALHTLQDFYAHSNWIEIGNTSINSLLGRSVMTDPSTSTAFCPDNPNVLSGSGLTTLTSGYYIGILGCGYIVDPTSIYFLDELKVRKKGKCFHGGMLGICDGINKDDPSRKPDHDYDTAYSLGSKATTDYLNQILDASGVAGNAKAIKALMRINGTLGMVIDDTGSMGAEINRVQKQVKKIVDNYAGTDKEPDEYLLVRFGDPDVGAAYTTTDTAAYLSKVNALSPSGGGDCPEYSQSGLLRAINASRNDSNIYLFTDASAKDASLANSVSAAAQAKRIKITALLTGSCSPISPAYYQNAEDTGGQIFILSPSELDKVFDLVRPQLSGDFVTINRTKGTFDSDEEQLAALVDSTISTVVFSATMDAKDSVALLRPDGSLVQEGDSGVTITQLNNGTIITVNDPESGEWKLSSSGSGSFAMSAQANSSLDIYTFEFVELFELAGGYRPIAGQPVVATESIVQSHMIGHYRNAEFRFVDEFGTTIEPLSLTTGDPYAAFDEFAGSVTLPDVPFRVAVSGIDESGEEYERLYPTLFRAQTVKVNLDAETGTDRLPAGVTTTLRFKVENLGDSTAEFSMNAVDSQSFITRVTPTLLTLASGESAVFEVDLHPPEDVVENTEVSITVTATDTDNSAITNSDTVEMLTAPSNQPPDCSTAYASTDCLRPPYHQLKDITIMGCTDPDSDPLDIIITSVTSDERVDSGKCPDAVVDTDGTFKLRAERYGRNGRVYKINFTASDGEAESSGTVQVVVPMSPRQSCEDVIDDGQEYDAINADIPGCQP